MALNPGELMPKRQPGLIARVMRSIVGYQRDIGPQQDERDTTQTGITMSSATKQVSQDFNLEDSRTDIYFDADDMDRLSEEVSVALDTIADNVVTSEDGIQMSFVATSKDQHVQEVIDQTNQVCGLHRKVRPMIRNVVKYGDMFGEIVINGQMELVDFKQLPPKTIHRNEDSRGNLLVGKPQYNGRECVNEPGQAAFDQRDWEDDDKLVAAFYPWQVVHTRLNWDGFSPYGRSLLRVSRQTWKKLRALEEAMTIARLTRSYMKLVFYIDTTGLGQAEKRQVLNDFQTNVRTRGRVDNKREAQYQVLTDFFMTTGTVEMNGQNVQQQSRIDVIDPQNGDLHQIDDVNFLHRKLLSTLRVPPAHMGFERDLNAKATLTQQDVQYVRFLRSLQQLIGQSLEQIYDTALALNGIDPSTAEYRIAWPMLKATDELSAAQAAAAYAQADAIYLGHGQMNNEPVIDPQWIMTNRLDMTPDEVEELSGRVEKQQAEDEAKQQAQQQQSHNNQLALVKARPTPDPQQQSGSSPAKAVAQDLTVLAEAMRTLKQDGKMVTPDEGQSDRPVVNIHEGAIQLSAPTHVDSGAVQVEHHSHVPVTIVSHPTDDGEPSQQTTVPARDAGDGGPE